MVKKKNTAMGVECQITLEVGDLWKKIDGLQEVFRKTSGFEFMSKKQITIEAIRFWLPKMVSIEKIKIFCPTFSELTEDDFVKYPRVDFDKLSGSIHRSFSIHIKQEYYNAARLAAIYVDRSAKSVIIECLEKYVEFFGI